MSEDWRPVDRPATGAAPWFIAAGVMVPLAMVLLVAGLASASLTLVYLSVLCSVVWLPLVAVGIVKLVRAQR